MFDEDLYVLMLLRASDPKQVGEYEFLPRMLIGRDESINNALQARVCSPAGSSGSVRSGKLDR